jgi:Zn-dependent peptidase ImmA (M78 family)
MGTDKPSFPIVQFLDVLLPKHFPQFVLEILTPTDMGAAHGLTYPDQHVIRVREDVYERAYQGEGRDRMTLAHELGHYILHSGLGLARMPAHESIPAYQDSEWQAKPSGANF